MRVTLVRTELITPSVTTFWFEPEHSVDYTPGQFVELLLPHDNPDDRGTKRWFTLSSSPTEPLIAITTKRTQKPSTFMQALFKLRMGSEVKITEAMGDFVLPQDKTIPLLFVVGGIGITPVRSMLKWLQDTHQQRNITMLYAASSREELAFHELIETMTNAYTYYISGQERLQTSSILDMFEKSGQGTLTYLSGPEELIEVLFAELKDAGIPMSRLVTDYFPGYGKI